MASVHFTAAWKCQIDFWLSVAVLYLPKTVGNKHTVCQHVPTYLSPENTPCSQAKLQVGMKFVWSCTEVSRTLNTEVSTHSGLKKKLHAPRFCKYKYLYVKMAS